MRGLVILLLSLIIVSSFGLLVLINNIHADSKKKISYDFQFHTFTSAICEEKNNLKYCRDELFVNCSGKISKANETNSCNGINLDSNKVSGFAVFDNEWKDSRK